MPDGYVDDSYIDPETSYMDMVEYLGKRGYDNDSATQLADNLWRKDNDAGRSAHAGFFAGARALTASKRAAPPVDGPPDWETLSGYSPRGTADARGVFGGVNDMWTAAQTTANNQINERRRQGQAENDGYVDDYGRPRDRQRLVDEQRQIGAKAPREPLASGGPGDAEPPVGSWLTWVQPKQKAEAATGRLALTLVSKGTDPAVAADTAAKLYAPLYKAAFLGGGDSSNLVSKYAQHDDVEIMPAITDSVGAAADALGSMFQGD